MFYSRDGKSVSRLGINKVEAEVVFEHHRGKPCRVKLSPILIGADRYEILIGRGRHLGWVGINFGKTKRVSSQQYSVKVKPLRSVIELPCYTSRRDMVHEKVEWKLTRDVLYIKIPNGTHELEGWWLHLPDVSDNPQDKLREIPNVSTLRRDSGEPSNDNPDEFTVEPDNDTIH